MPTPRRSLMLLGTALAAALSAGPAAAAPGWLSYLNARFGYEALVPLDFAGLGESDNGDGQLFRRADGQARLWVWGGYSVEGSFADEAAAALADLKQDGWTITYQATTPGWASYSGTKGPRVVYYREISGCGGERYAAFKFDYPATEITAMRPIVDRLVAGLTQRSCR